MTTEQASSIAVGSILIPNDTIQEVEGRMGSAIQCISVAEQGLRFRRMNVQYNREEFFLTAQALGNSQWEIAPQGCQLRFT